MTKITLIPQDSGFTSTLTDIIQQLNAITQGELVYQLADWTLLNNCTLQHQEYDKQSWLLGLPILEYLAQQKASNTFVFVTDLLQGANYRNAFSVNADSNAVITTDSGSTKFLPDLRTYLLYFIIRQTLSTLVPALKVHMDTPECYLCAKIKKSDVVISAKAGSLCESCSKKLAEKCTPTIIRSLQGMMQVVAQKMP